MESKYLEKSNHWGRAWAVEMKTAISSLLILTLTPLMVFYFYICAFFYDCALTAPIMELVSGNLTLSSVWEKIPSFSTHALAVFACWYLLQLFLALIPDYFHRIIKWYKGGKLLGAVTPAGNQLPYNINGLQAWSVSLTLFLLGWIFNIFSPTIIFDNWGGLLIIANIVGFSLAIFTYIKAFIFPSYINDRLITGNPLYDFYMGVELNPRLGPLDFKLFFNGRPGIIGWTLINLSFAFAQYYQYGFVTNSMILVNVFQAMYVLSFFWDESCYLKTIDIHHDHFGWMLAWGDSVWLPFMYTLQALFLVFHPLELSLPYFIFVFLLGIIGFYICYSANNQKNIFRQNDGNISIWKEKANFIPCEYLTSDGEKRKSKLLTSGWWGISRHMNYTGDLIFSLAISLACGTEYLFPYFYFVFMTILLIHRCFRDEHRCGHKYGKSWEQYCQKVPYRLIPGVF